MIHIFSKIKFLRKKYKVQGFILPFTMLLSVLILLITSSAMTLLSKQLYFSKLYRQSQTAYYAADDAIACALEIDDTYVGSDGLGIFPNSTTTDGMVYINDVLNYINTKRLNETPPLVPIDLDSIKCAQSAIFKVASSSFAVSSVNYIYYSVSLGQEDGRTVSYMMRMPLGDGTYRCAKVTINKTQSFRQIIAQGYAQCDNPNGSVERAVVNTTASN